MICLDNSEFMRNGDYAPTRLQAQTETVNYIINAKIQGNQETTCGVLSMAGERIESHSSPCRNMGALMTALTKDVQIKGQADFLAGLKVAKLALKNRPNKNQRQRIIMFVGSPITVPEKKLTQLGGKFKKDNIAVDVINFGAENSTNDNVEKLEKFIAAVNSSDNSHLVNIPPGPHILSDLVLSSAIMNDGAGGAVGGGGGVGAGAGGGGGFGGVDAGMDPELAMALRISMEEERQRQERAAAPAGAAADASKEDAAVPATPVPAAAAAAEPAAMEDDEYDDDDEDALLAQAIAMSLAAAGGPIDDDDAEMTPAPAPAAVATPAPAGPASTPAAPSKPVAATSTTDADDIAEALQDENFLASLLESVPGVDQDDLALDDILTNLMGGDTEEKDKK